MRTVQTGWEEYYSMAMAVSGVSKDSIQYKETRRAFYAGAALMFELATGMSGLSDDAAVEVLKGLSHLPVVQALLAYNRASKIKSSYIDNMFKYLVNVNGDIGWVHPSIKHWNVVTHRLSVEKPAAQTQPKFDKSKDVLPLWLSVS